MTSIEPDPREERLPKWARDRMAYYRRLATTAEARVNAAKAYAEGARDGTKPGETDTVLDPYDPHPIGLKPGTRVRFKVDLGLPPKMADRIGYVDITARGGHVELMAGGPMTLHPQVSNVLHVKLRGH
ncbi:hypothetical protein O7635_29445 [Asanoa sp. WMMD1127]|uniref:DUF7239 family protein n=1 Tax=Asanoa sp. WMMD1127 TaxID=3016107 RepID=UPI00241669D5|nr:hypothetical protein [Asanoa sp. WMMD1127]MDG4825994.1 hypothetical protein [Asanoa sp. WMMD1127]